MRPAPRPDPVPDPQRVRRLFDEALLVPPDQREAFVRRHGGEDDALAREVLSLLRMADADATQELHAAGRAGFDQARAAGNAKPRPPGGHSTATDELLGRLAAAPRLDTDRYEIEGEAGGGGMGAIVRLRDRHLNRRLAMKVPFDRVVLDAEDAQLARNLLARFLEEAQVTSQLDHPGVVPVHDLGLDQNGRVYFTMRLVQGRTADKVFADARAQHDGWTTTRALEVLLKVCDTIAFAHSRGVLHRDLKPANVMVGAFGEVYVLDWGLAKVRGTPEREDDPRTALATTRQRDAHGDTGAGTRMGTPSYMSPEQARGEPVDEQTDVYAIGAMLYELLGGSAPFANLGLGANAVVEKVATTSPPHLEELDGSTPAELVAITEKAMARDPVSRYAAVAQLAADLRAFLDQRAVKAYRTGALVELRLWMRRNKGLAASMVAAAGILIAGILGISVYADEAKRNEQVAQQQQQRADAKVREFDLLSGVVLYERAIANEADLYPPWPHKIAAMETWLKEDAGKVLAMRGEIERTIRDLEARALPPTAEDREADRRSHPRFAEYVRLEKWVASLRYAQSIREGSARLVVPELSTAQQALDASALLMLARERVAPTPEDRRSFGEEPFGLAAAQLAAQRAKGTPVEFEALGALAWAMLANGQDAEAQRIGSLAFDLAPDEQAASYEAHFEEIRRSCAEASIVLAAAQRELAGLSSALDTQRKFRFAAEADQFLHSTLVKLRDDVRSLEAKEKPSVEQRLFWARQVRDLTLAHPNARHTWDEVRAAVAKNPKYADQKIALSDDEIMGLVPLGENPVTKLWEFYDLRSAWDGQGDPRAIQVPVHDPSGSIAVGDETGIVFALLPGACFWMGAQNRSPMDVNYDPGAQEEERPVRVFLRPFMIARHEMTQGQWLRLWPGPDFKTPSRQRAPRNAGGQVVTLANPVESVDWPSCNYLLCSYGMNLPTEAQWEYACRAGTSTPWSVPADRLREVANLADASAKKFQPRWPCEEWVDDHVVHARVGSFASNSFGLFDMHGNVWEWCQDSYARTRAPIGDDGLQSKGGRGRCNRGGSFDTLAVHARSAGRSNFDPTVRNYSLGVRAARSIRP